MRVVVASSGLGHIARGIEAWAADLGRALAERNMAVQVCKGGGRVATPYERVIPCWHRESAQARRLLRCMPRFLGWRLGAGSDYEIEQTTFAWNLIQHLRREPADVLHVQDPLVALIAQRANQIGWIRTRTILAHGTEETPDFLRKITYLQHLAPWHQEQCSSAGVAKPTWTAIPNFVDTDLFRSGRSDPLRAELGIPDKALVVLSVAAVKRQHKRIDHLLGEFARLRQTDPDLPVWLIVAGGWEAETDELVAEGTRALGDRVRFLVRFPRQRITELYRAADAFVLCSLKEMMPIALLEAAASGLPCLVNRHPVLQWIIGSGGGATDMETSGALADALRELLHNAERRQLLGGHARRHCLASFSKDAVINQILEYYRLVLTHDRPAPVELHRPLVQGTAGSATPRSVSVVIPSFNSGRFVTQAVESALAQTVTPDQIIVIDDGSSDDTRERLAQYRDKIRYVYQDNRGVAAARNHGIECSQDEFVAFLDADDVWHPRKLELQLKALAQNPRIALLGASTYGWPADGVPDVDDAATALVAMVPWERLAVRNQFTTSSVLARRDVLHRVGLFDTALHGPEDFDLWLRVAEVASVANLQLPLTGYRTVADSLGRQAGTMERGLRRVLQKLDQKDAWRGRRLLRRKAHSYCRYSCAYLHATGGSRRMALTSLIDSLRWYPLPYRRSEVRMSLARARMLTMIIWRLVRGIDGARAA